MKKNDFIYFLKKKIFFLKKYVFELYIELFNFRFLKKNTLRLKILKKKIKKIKNIIRIKLNENSIRYSFRY